MAISEYLKNLRAQIGPTPLLMPGVCVVIVNAAGGVLLHRASDDGLWRTIGGAMDPHEEPAAAARREAFEETGLEVAVERLAAVYAGPEMAYPNGDVVWYVTLAFRGRPVGREQPRVADDESLELAYFSPGNLPCLTAHDRKGIRAALAGEAAAWFAAGGP